MTVGGRGGGGDGWPRCECTSVCTREGRIDATPNGDTDYGNLAMHCKFVAGVVNQTNSKHWIRRRRLI